MPLPREAFLRTVPDWRGRRVTLMGLGLFGGGLGAALFFARAGARLTITDLRPEADFPTLRERLRDFDVRLVLGRHEPDDFTGADVVVVNPAVPDDSPFLAAARRAGVPLETELNLFWKLCPSCRILAVTGSNGKTTTAALLAQGLRAMSAPVHLGGNIGGSLLDRLDTIRADDFVVLEVSSFQAERLDALAPRPAVAIITNLVPNHLDRHGTMVAYARAKAVLLHYQTPRQAKVLNSDDPGSRPFFSAGAGRTRTFGTAGDVRVERDAVAGTSWRLDLSARRLRARFHLANMAAAAAAIESAAGVDARAIEAAWNSFPGVPHRLEDVGTVRGVRCVNDSIATNPDATIAALENIEGPVVLIAGGSDKGVPFGALGRAIARRVRALVTIGATAAAIEAAVREAGGTLPVRRAGSLEEAVDQAFAIAQPGDTLLLSPACASYDMFRNFEQRGDLFRSLVRRHGDHADLGAHPARTA